MTFRKTKTWAAITLALAATALVGCGTTPIMQKASEVADANGGPRIRIVFEQSLPDGRTVLCVYAGYYRSGGLSCDWEGAR